MAAAVDLTKPFFIDSDYLVIFDQDKETNLLWRGKVYPYYRWTRGDQEGISYQPKNNSDSEDEIDKARCLFEFSHCWRGTWEGRIYFLQDEYWGEDLSSMNEIWKRIRWILEERIKRDNPQYIY